MSGADTIRQAHDAIIKAAVDRGQLLEAGFLALKVQVLPDATPGAVDVARKIYMAGAQHLYASMMAAFDAGDEITASDMRRMALIDAELRAFAPQLAAMVAGPRTGSMQ